MNTNPNRLRSTFVTGATGLLGNNLVRELVARGYAVKALVRFPAWLWIVRRRLPRCWFDAVFCAGGVKALRAYRRQVF